MPCESWVARQQAEAIYHPERHLTRTGSTYSTHRLDDILSIACQLLNRMSFLPANILPRHLKAMIVLRVWGPLCPTGRHRAVLEDFRENVKYREGRDTNSDLLEHTEEFVADLDIGFRCWDQVRIF